LNVDGSDAVLLARLDGEVDYETSPIRIVFSDRGDDPHVDVAVLEIKPAQQLAIRFDPVRIVDIARLQKCEKWSGFGCLDLFLEAAGCIGEIGDEVARPDHRLYTLVHMSED